MASTGDGTRQLVLTCRLYVAQNGGQVYADKQEYDEMDDRDGNPRRSLPEFLFDGFFRKYGLRQLAERKVVDVVSSIAELKRLHPRVRLFAQFCGLGDKLPTDALNFMLLLLNYYKRCVRHPCNTRFPCVIDGWVPQSPRSRASTQGVVHHHGNCSHGQRATGVQVDVSKRVGAAGKCQHRPRRAGRSPDGDHRYERRRRT